MTTKTEVRAAADGPKSARTAIAVVGLAIAVGACRQTSTAATDAGPAELGAKDTAAPKPPPPLRVPHPPVPPLPDLPPIEHHDPPAKLPLGLSTSILGGLCKGVWNGSE